MSPFLYPITNFTKPSLGKPRALFIKRWGILLETHPNSNDQKTILSIIIWGINIRYYGPKQKVISGNLSSATNNPDILMTDLKNQIAADCLIKISYIGNHCISSPLGLAPKSNRE